MDITYVPNLTVGPLVCAALRPHVELPLDVHLMVKPVDGLVPAFAKAGGQHHQLPSRGLRARRPHHRADSGARCKPGLVLKSGDAAELPRPHPRGARPGADHVGEPGIRRPAVHSLRCFQRSPRRAGASTRRARTSGSSSGAMKLHAPKRLYHSEPRAHVPRITRRSRVRRKSPSRQRKVSAPARAACAIFVRFDAASTSSQMSLRVRVDAPARLGDLWKHGGNETAGRRIPGSPT